MNTADDQVNDPSLGEVRSTSSGDRLASSHSNEAAIRIEIPEHKIHSDRGRLPIATADGLLYVPFDSLLYLRAEGGYTYVLVDGKQRYLTCSGIGVLECALPKGMFQRCHHAHVINLMKVSRLFRTGGHRVQLVNGDMVEVSRRKWRALLEAMEALR